MKLRRRVAAIMLIAAMVLCSEGETRRALAQDAPPDLRMLMNLELFEPRHNDARSAPSPDAPPSAPTDDSLLDQIRALDSMGYLGNHEGGGNGAPAPRAAEEAPESEPPESADSPPRSAHVAPAMPAPASHPSYDVEGPQP